MCKYRAYIDLKATQEKRMFKMLQKLFLLLYEIHVFDGYNEQNFKKFCFVSF